MRTTPASYKDLKETEDRGDMEGSVPGESSIHGVREHKISEVLQRDSGNWRGDDKRWDGMEWFCEL
jgi:hypothetical protein